MLSLGLSLNIETETEKVSVLILRLMKVKFRSRQQDCPSAYIGLGLETPTLVSLISVKFRNRHFPELPHVRYTLPFSSLT